jgi:hypothetical protein
MTDLTARSVLAPEEISRTTVQQLISETIIAGEVNEVLIFSKFKASINATVVNAQAVINQMSALQNVPTGGLLSSQIGLKLNHERLIRAHAISGKGSIANIKYLEKRMRTNGFDINTPIEVAVHHDKFYILNGHHRYRAAMMAGINEIPIKIITDIKNHPSGWDTIEEVVEAAARCGPDRLIFKY